MELAIDEHSVAEQLVAQAPRGPRTMRPLGLVAVGQERLEQACRCGAADAVRVLGVPLVLFHCKKKTVSPGHAQRPHATSAQVNSCIVAQLGSAGPRTRWAPSASPSLSATTRSCPVFLVGRS